MRRLYLVVLLMSSLLLISSCGEDEGFTSAPIPSAFIATVNAIPDSPELVVITSKSQTLGRIQYGESSGLSAVLPQIPINYTVQYLDNDTAVTLLDTRTTIEISDIEVIVFAGTLAAPTVVTVNATPFTFDEGTTDTRFRLLNVTTTVSSATLTLTNPNAATQTITMINGQPTEAIITTAGNGLQIEVKDSATNALLWSSGEFTLNAAVERLFILRDYFGPGTQTTRLDSINETTRGGLFPNELLESAIRYANMIPDRGPVDFLVDGTVVTANVAFGTVTDYISVNPADIEVSVTATGDATDIFASSTRTILPGNFLTFGTAGLVDGINETSLTIDDQRNVPTRARFTLTNLAPSFPNVDVFLADPGGSLESSVPVFIQLSSFASSNIDLPNRSFDIFVTTSGTATVVFGPQQLDFETNGIYSLILRDFDGGGEPLSIVLDDDFVN